MNVNIKSVLGWLVSSALICLGVVIGISFLAVIAAPIAAYIWFSYSYVLSCFWLWFIIPVFPQLPILGVGNALGIIFVILLCKMCMGILPADAIKHSVEYGDLSKEQQMIFWASLVGPWGLCLMGWIVKLIVY
jgi:hypothetical protein|tara:strand:- start:853 stop:1251 length:399 start_codon:yes stop_codon:yes gene_type:complete